MLSLIHLEVRFEDLNILNIAINLKPLTNFGVILTRSLEEY